MATKNSHLLAVTIGCLLADTGANASPMQRAAIGAATGTIGGVVAGPVGAVAGVALADHMIVKADDAVAQNKESADALKNQQVAQLREELKYTEDETNIYKHLLLQAYEFDVMFNSASYEVNNKDLERLSSLPKILKENPNISVELSGYADPTGNSDANLQLSKQRVQSVTGYLLSNDVPKDQIVQHAFGSEKSSATNSNDYYRERIVSIRLQEGNKTT